MNKQLKQISKRYIVLSAFAFASALWNSLAVAEEKVLSKGDVEQIIHNYIMTNPQVVMDSIQAMQKREALAKLQSHRDELFSAPADPIAGKHSGDATVVEFFDYNCRYCKRSMPVVTQLLKEDDKLRIVFKEYPILGPESRLAAKAALAVNMIAKDRYLDFHVALMNQASPKSEKDLLEIAQSAGLDAVALKAKMADLEIDKILKANHDLASAIGVQGTPAFIIGDELIPSAIDIDALRSKIKALRSTVAKAK